jgi:23S rRNA (adenine2503-C2)-methyltransferase
MPKICLKCPIIMMPALAHILSIASYFQQAPTMIRVMIAASTTRPTAQSASHELLGQTVDCSAQRLRQSVSGGFDVAQRAISQLLRTGTIDSAIHHLPWPSVGQIVRTHASQCDEGAVVKFTQRVPKVFSVLPVLGDDAFVETESVLIPMIGERRTRSYTLCVSSQVGCAMGCGFCQTAQMGLVRSLLPHEIIGQWFAARALLGLADLRENVLPAPTTTPSSGLMQAHRSYAQAQLGQRVLARCDDAMRADASLLDCQAPIRNIVFMGMGEPLDNLENVLAAVDVFADKRGCNIAPSRVTISTVGRLDGMAMLREKVLSDGYHRLGLAVSVNAPSDVVRSTIMPINRSMPMAHLREMIASWPRFGSSHVMLEYVLIPGLNSDVSHAQELADWVLGQEGSGAIAGPKLVACVNVIPYNPRESSPWPAPSEEVIEAFIAELSSKGIYVKRRRTKGRDQMAACGQLGNLHYARRR